jgi:hypothetical protein
MWKDQPYFRNCQKVFQCCSSRYKIRRAKRLSFVVKDVREEILHDVWVEIAEIIGNTEVIN